jgi:hypothetical protein
MAGVAAAYEALRAGRSVCMTEITDWVGGQVSSQGTSALDERPTQRSRLYFPYGYLQMRQQLIAGAKGNSRPGDCWVSEVCVLPQQGHTVLISMLKAAANQGKGQLKFFPNTVVKALHLEPDAQPNAQTPQVESNPVGKSELIKSAIAIQHRPAVGAVALNTYPLSQTVEDAYRFEDSALFTKTVLKFVPPPSGQWIVIEATETGELLAVADLPYRLGIDGLTPTNPSASSQTNYPYCAQALTYTFALEATATPQQSEPPSFYRQYEPFYSYDLPRYAQTPALVFSYRRIWSAKPGQDFASITPGDISMQNWGGGNDFGPGTSEDNILLTRNQLVASGQLLPGHWQGGLRTSSLQKAESLAQGYFYWLLAGTTDAKLGAGVKQPWQFIRYLKGLNSPMGTVHGLSKYPYIRESRRLVGRYDYSHDGEFSINEVDIARRDYQEDPHYRTTLSVKNYAALRRELKSLSLVISADSQLKVLEVARRRSRIYPDSVGIGHYSIDFHPCMQESPPEKPGNIERLGERQGAAQTYPFQIPLRAMIPPRINNLLVTGKNIAMSHIAAAAYRTHAIEWSAGAAAGTTADFALKTKISPYQLVDNLPRVNKGLEAMQKHLVDSGNPIAFPNTSIFNQDWQDWD